jgi:hypothetical protein
LLFKVHYKRPLEDSRPGGFFVFGEQEERPNGNRNETWRHRTGDQSFEQTGDERRHPKGSQAKKGIREAQRQKEEEAARGSEAETEGGEEERLRGETLREAIDEITVFARGFRL